MSAALAFLIVGAVAVIGLPPLITGSPWGSPGSSSELWPAVQLVLFALGGTIAVVGVSLSLLRHDQELRAAERDYERLARDAENENVRRNEAMLDRRIDQERSLRQRFVTIVALLADPAPTTRQAALFGLGALADDWQEFGRGDEVQVCIEVLTAYLRAPLPEDSTRTDPAEVTVKRAGYAVLQSHLERGRYSWGGVGKSICPKR